MIADLHSHTYYSDGEFSPETLVRNALKTGLRHFAISDHDHLGAIAEAQALTRNTPLEIIPAVEINTDWRNEEVHILGYFIDPEHEGLTSALAGQRRSRELRVEAIIRKLQQLGIDITLEKVKTKGKGTLGRPHVAFVLEEMGLAGSVREAFEKYIVRGAPAYVPRREDSMNPVEAIRVIKAAGGVSVMAHPGVVKNFSSILDALMGEGLDGIEVYHPQNPPLISAYLEEVAEKNDLIITGGSDFHGDGLGPSRGLGVRELKPSHIQKLKERAGSHPHPSLSHRGRGDL